MPKIQQYISRADVPGPVRSVPGGSIDAINPIAKNVSHLGNTLMDAGEAINKKDEQDEISDLSVQFAEQHANLKQRLDDETQKGTLDTEKFNEDVSDSFDKIGSDIQTRGGAQFFKQQGTTLQMHLLESSRANSAVMAEAKAKANYVTALNTQSSVLVNDPSSFEAAKKMHDETLDALVRNGLTSSAAEQLRVTGRSELAKSAIKGMIDLNPDAAKKQLDSGKWNEYFPGETKDQLYGQVDQAKRGQIADQERILRLQKEAQSRQEEAWSNDALPKVVDGTLDIKSILRAPISEHVKEHFINMIRTESGQSNKTNPAIENQLFNRIVLPDGDPNKIYDPSQIFEKVGKGLNVDGAMKLNGILMNGRTPEGKQLLEMQKGFFATAESQLVKKDALGMADPDGQMNMASFRAAAFQKINEQRKAGRPVSELFDPHSKAYLGTMIDQYRKTPQQIMETYSNRLTAKPAEDAADPMVDVISPDGVPGRVPKSKLDAAIARKFKVK